MNNPKNTLLFALILIAIQGVSQDIPRGHQRVPVFESAADSVEYAQLNLMLRQDLRQRFGKKANKAYDSIFSRMEKMNSRIKSYRTIYYPQRDYTIINENTDPALLPELQKVSLYRASEIPDVLWSCRKVYDLELVDCNIRKLPKQLSSLPNLNTIRVFHYRGKKRMKFSKNPVLTKVVIQGTNAKLMPSTLKKLRNLKTLDLSENDLTSFPNLGSKNRKLIELSLQRNKLTLEGRISPHPTLQQLALHENLVSHVPASIARFPSLKKLNFNRNQVTSVDDGLAKLSKLEQLSFYNNQLEAIPPSVYQLTGLQDLDLFHNRIETIDSAFTNWRNLRSLYISHNKLVYLPNNLDTLKNLEGLYAWDNRIGELPECIGKMTSLKYLRVNKNYIKRLPDNFTRLRQLEEIDLARNYLTDFPIEVFSWNDLKILSLSVNPWSKENLDELEKKVLEARARDVFVHFGDDEPEN